MIEFYLKGQCHILGVAQFKGSDHALPIERLRADLHCLIGVIQKVLYIQYVALICGLAASFQRI